MYVEVLTKTRKIGKFTAYFASSQFFILSHHIFFILSVFSSSHITTSYLATIFHCVTNLFLCFIRNHVSLASHNHNPCTRSYRGPLCMYFWYFKKKGVNVSNPRHKNTCPNQICVTTTGQCWPKVPTFGCCGDMLPTCCQHSQPSLG